MPSISAVQQRQGEQWYIDWDSTGLETAQDGVCVIACVCIGVRESVGEKVRLMTGYSQAGNPSPSFSFLLSVGIISFFPLFSLQS